MTIDIQPGDTFTASHSCGLYQHRNDKERFISVNGDGCFYTASNHQRRLINREAAIAWIRDGLGHTVQETQPPPAPVPWPTHAVVSNLTGCIIRLGTEQACRDWIGCEADTQAYTVRPLAPAPLTPAMRAFIEAVRKTTDYVEVDEAARNLLAEGGAQ